MRALTVLQTEGEMRRRGCAALACAGRGGKKAGRSTGSTGLTSGSVSAYLSMSKLLLLVPRSLPDRGLIDRGRPGVSLDGLWLLSGGSFSLACSLALFGVGLMIRCRRLQRRRFRPKERFCPCNAPVEIVEGPRPPP